jgi:hypothetical protein
MAHIYIALQCPDIALQLTYKGSCKPGSASKLQKQPSRSDDEQAGDGWLGYNDCQLPMMQMLPGEVVYVSNCSSTLAPPAVLYHPVDTVINKEPATAGNLAHVVTASWMNFSTNVAPERRNNTTQNKSQPTNPSNWESPLSHSIRR